MRQPHVPASWSLVCGIALGLGLGTGALFGIGGVIGVGVCLLVLGPVCWLGKDAEPVWEGVRASRTAQALPATDAAPSEAEVTAVSELAEPLDMVALPGGTFLMGSPNADVDAYGNEKPQHQVTVSDFCISRYPITRQLYREVVGQTPPEWTEATDDVRLPANYVSWFEAVAFCNLLSEYVGLQPCYRIDGTRVAWDTSANGYRLPTEAEWEYACRAVTTTRWFCGDDPAELERYAWFASNSGRRVHPVGAKAPNPWGLRDMIGNVYEWCWDWYGAYRNAAVADPTGAEDGTSRALRGGSAWRDPWLLRSALRDGDQPEDRRVGIGCRCVRRPRRQQPAH